MVDQNDGGELVSRIPTLDATPDTRAGETPRMIYFDHNATTPMLPEARQAWLDATEKFIGNPSSPHRVGSRADAAIIEARQQLAEFLGCDALDILWTSGAT